jgi:signal transduction histidine kinase
LGFALAAATRLFYFVVLVVATAASKAQRELDRARIEKLEHAQELEREILRTSEREQQRIGRDLHDSLGPHLAAIGYAASFLANELRGRDLAEAASAQKIGELVAEAVSLTRDLARGLFPVQMGGAGLCMALEDLANTTSRRRGIAVSFCESGDPRIEDPREAMHLYRIAQEAVHNAAKHGGATSVTIVLGKSEGCLRLIIADDGKGLPQSQNITRGVGLHSMRSRALALKGIIEITSNPGEGTIVSCEIPLGSIELAAVVP